MANGTGDRISNKSSLGTGESMHRKRETKRERKRESAALPVMHADSMLLPILGHILFYFMYIHMIKSKSHYLWA